MEGIPAGMVEEEEEGLTGNAEGVTVAAEVEAGVQTGVAGLVKGIVPCSSTS